MIINWLFVSSPPYIIPDFSSFTMNLREKAPSLISTDTDLDILLQSNPNTILSVRDKWFKD